MGEHHPTFPDCGGGSEKGEDHPFPDCRGGSEMGEDHPFLGSGGGLEGSEAHQLVGEHLYLPMGGCIQIDWVHPFSYDRLYL